jgi:hypothetical protein
LTEVTDVSFVEVDEQVRLDPEEERTPDIDRRRDEAA